MNTNFLILVDEEAQLTRPPGRYEFRCWPERIPPAAGTLQQDWQLTGAEVRNDIYLLSTISDVCLVKLRDGERLEIKQRSPDTGKLQYWSLAQSLGFPLSPSDLLELAISLGLGELPSHSATCSSAHLITELYAAPGALTILPVRKARQFFRRGSCRVELARVDWAGQRALSIAVEDPDGPSALAALDDLDIGRYPNQSYGEFLQHRRLTVHDSGLHPNTSARH